MKRRILYILLFFSPVLMAQSASEAEALFNNKQYLKAKNVYESLLKKRPNDALNNYRYARCCYELKDYEPAIKHFELAGNKYPLKDLYLGELYFVTYRFEESIAAYQIYMSTLAPGDKKYAETEAKLKKAETAAKLLNRVEDIAILDSVVVNKNEFLRYYKFSSELGTLAQKPVKLSTRQSQDKVIYTTQRGDRLCFSDSLRGNMDIFSSFKLLDTWSAPVSVSNAVNTAANENYPFLLLDGVTLYFASDGENSIGGYDIFITKYASTTQDFLVPENIGMPFNSPANDYMMVMDEQQRIGWFATDRNQPAGKVMIYKFIPNETKILFRTGDKDLLRRVAQLKVNRKAENVNIYPVENHQREETANEAKFSVVINDSTIYTRFEQVQSKQALSKFKEWFKMKEELQNLKNKLEQMREHYYIVQKTEEKNMLMKKILSSEQESIDLEKLAQQKLLEACNLEIKFIDNK